jgi:hypothetical protein
MVEGLIVLGRVPGMVTDPVELPKPFEGCAFVPA